MRNEAISHACALLRNACPFHPLPETVSAPKRILVRTNDACTEQRFAEFDTQLSVDVQQCNSDAADRSSYRNAASRNTRASISTNDCEP